jgi:hypothetical protein
MKNLLQLSVLFILLGLGVSAQTLDRLPCIDKKFSVVVHIVLDSLNKPGILEADIRANFDKLNADFAPICVSFEICDFDTVVNFKYNSLNDRKDTPEWKELPVLYNHKNRLNVYYVGNLVWGRDKYGYSYEGGIKNTDFSCVIVLKEPFVCCNPVWKALGHEMGHFFGLKDTFETDNGSELVNGTNAATAGDLISDTGADPFFEGNLTEWYVFLPTCTFVNKSKDLNGQYYDPMVGNIMSHYPDKCNCGFTHDQLHRMAQVYLASIGMW